MELTEVQIEELADFAKSESDRQGMPVTPETILVEMFAREAKRVETARLSRKNNRIAKYMREQQARGKALTILDAEIALGYAKRA